MTRSRKHLGANKDNELNLTGVKFLPRHVQPWPIMLLSTKTQHIKLQGQHRDQDKQEHIHRKENKAEVKYEKGDALLIFLLKPQWS